MVPGTTYDAWSTAALHSVVVIERHELLEISQRNLNLIVESAPASSKSLVFLS